MAVCVKPPSGEVYKEARMNILFHSCVSGSESWEAVTVENAAS